MEETTSDLLEFQQLERIQLADLTPYPNNPRKHSERQIDEYIKSLKAFKQIRPLVIDEKGVILVGHGIYYSYRKMGQAEALVIRRTDLTEKEKQKLVLADNQIQELGTTDFDLVYAMLRDIGEVEIPGFDPDIIDSLLNTVNEELDEYTSSLEPLSEGEDPPEDYFKEAMTAGQSGEGGGAEGFDNTDGTYMSEEGSDFQDSGERGTEEPPGTPIKCPHCGEVFVYDSRL